MFLFCFGFFVLSASRFVSASSFLRALICDFWGRWVFPAHRERVLSFVSSPVSVVSSHVLLVYRDIWDSKALQVCTADHLTKLDVFYSWGCSHVLVVKVFGQIIKKIIFDINVCCVVIFINREKKKEVLLLIYCYFSFLILLLLLLLLFIAKHSNRLY